MEDDSTTTLTMSCVICAIRSMSVGLGMWFLLFQVLQVVRQLIAYSPVPSIGHPLDQKPGIGKYIFLSCGNALTPIQNNQNLSARRYYGLLKNQNQKIIFQSTDLQGI